MKKKTIECPCNFCGCVDCCEMHHWPIMRREAKSPVLVDIAQQYGYEINRQVPFCPRCHKLIHSICGHWKMLGGKGGRRTAERGHFTRNLKQYRPNAVNEWKTKNRAARRRYALTGEVD